MLPRDRAAKILTMHAAGWPATAIAEQLGHAPQTIRDYIEGRTIPGVRAPRASLLTELLASYCRKRFAEDPRLRPNTLFREVTEIGFKGSRGTFYRELKRGRLSPPVHRQSVAPQEPPQDLTDMSRPFVHASAHNTALPRPVTPVTGEALISYLTRLAHANGLALSEILAILPSWFTTKVNNGDDRAQHHMLVPATADALRALAHLTNATETGLARALPAFGNLGTHNPLRATTACRRCTARRGIHQPIPVHLPIHHKVCIRHGIWLADTGQPQLDLASCPEIITAQRRVTRLLHRHTPQQLTLAQQGAVSAIPAWPATPAAIPLHWRYRLLTLQTANHHRGLPTDHEVFTHAAIYPDVITRAAMILNSGQEPRFTGLPHDHETSAPATASHEFEAPQVTEISMLHDS